MKDLTFHIIFTPGTVKYLRLFTLSLLKWLDCSFRLVPNGCSQEETEMLRRFVERHARLELLALPWKEIQKHSKVLIYLQQQEQSEFFGFLDSDIFATGNFLQEASEALQHADAFFSGLPFWQDAEEYSWKRNMTEISGHHTRTQEGRVLGATYCAIYRNALLADLATSTNIALRAYRWKKIAPAYRARLRKVGLKTRFYDTAKLSNIFLQEQGAKLCYQDLPSLHHIGGFSANTASTRHRKLSRNRVLKDIKRPLSNMRDWLFHREYLRQWDADMERIALYKQHFSHLLVNLIERGERRFPGADSLSAMHPETAKVEQYIMALYDEFKHEL